MFFRNQKKVEIYKSIMASVEDLEKLKVLILPQIEELKSIEVGSTASVLLSQLKDKLSKTQEIIEATTKSSELKLKELEQQIAELSDKIVNSSWFDRDYLGEVLCGIINVYKLTRYKYLAMKDVDGGTLGVLTSGHIISPEEVSKYSNNTTINLGKDRRLCFYEKTKHPQFKFDYLKKTEFEYYILEPHIHNFVDKMINFRVQNNTQEITYERLQRLKEEFFISIIEELKQTFSISDSRAAKQINIFQQELDKLQQEINALQADIENRKGFIDKLSDIQKQKKIGTVANK